MLGTEVLVFEVLGSESTRPLGKGQLRHTNTRARMQYANKPTFSP